MHEECGCIKYDDAESRTVGSGGGGSGSRNRRKFHRPLRHLADEITAWVHPRSPTISTPTPKPLTFPDSPRKQKMSKISSTENFG